MAPQSVELVEACPRLPPAVTSRRARSPCPCWCFAAVRRLEVSFLEICQHRPASAINPGHGSPGTRLTALRLLRSVGSVLRSPEERSRSLSAGLLGQLENENHSRSVAVWSYEKDHIATILPHPCEIHRYRGRRSGPRPGLPEEAINAFDKVVGLDLSEVSVDGSLHKAPMGEEGTGPIRPTGARQDGSGPLPPMPMECPSAGSPKGPTATTPSFSTLDDILLAPTLDDVKQRGLLSDVETLWLDRGYDSKVTRTRLAERGVTDAMIAKKRTRGSATSTKRQPMGLLWAVERTNSWLSNFGQLRRNTDRFNAHRLAQFALAIALIITVKLAKWAKCWDGLAAA